MKVCLSAMLLSIICLSFSYACFPMEHGELSDTVITERHIIKDPVSSVQLSFGTLRITQIAGEEQEMLVVKTHENVHPLLQMSLSRGGCLSLGFEDGTVIQSEIILEYELKVKSLTAVQILGCGTVLCDAGFSAEQLAVNISGNGDFKSPALRVGHLNIAIAGNGEVSITNLSDCSELYETISGNGSVSFGGGVAGCQKIEISGNGSVDSSQLKGVLGVVRISGFGSAAVNIDGELLVEAASEDMVINHGSAVIDFKKPAARGICISGSSVVVGPGGWSVGSIVVSGSGGVFVNGRKVA